MAASTMIGIQMRAVAIATSVTIAPARDSRDGDGLARDILDTSVPAFLSTRPFRPPALQSIFFGDAVPYPDSSHQPQAAAAASVLPRSCPACGATRLVTTAKVPSDQSYWRCLLCGEIWTPARRQTRSAR